MDRRELEIIPFLENMSSILAKILCVDKFDVPVTLKTRLVNGVGENDLELASIDYVQFLVRVEEEYGIICDFETQIYTIEDVYNYINNYCEAEGR